MLNLTNSLDNKKFETDNYSFSDFEEAYFSGELLKWLYTKMKHSGSKLSQSQIDKGFNYVKDRRSTHHWHNTRATLFDWNSPVLLDFPALFDWVVKLKEKHFLKILAWRFGQLIKLYMLRKENISDINSNSYSEKEEQQKELDDDNTKTALFLNSTKTIIWKKKREELAEQFSTKLGTLDEKMKDTASKIIIEATGKDIDDAKVEIPMPLEEAEL